MPRSGYGQPGGRETTIVGKASEVDTPWQVMWMCVRADGVAIAAIASFIYVVAFWVTCAVTANTFILPWPPWWLRWLPVKTITLLYIVGRSWVRFWPGLLWSLPIWVLVWLVAFPVHAWILVWMRGVPEQINRNYPPQYNAMDATGDNLGLTFWDWWKRIRNGTSKPDPQPGPQRWHVSAELVENKSNLYLDFEIDDPVHWFNYCRAWQQQRKPAWSVRGFAEFGLGDDYTAINAKFLGLGGVAVSKEYKDGRREYEPSARGRAFIRAFATTPPPRE